MKKYILPLAFIFVAAATATSCNSSAAKVENAEQDVIDAQIKLEQVRQDSIADYEKTQKAWDAQIAQNDVTIAEYKLQIAKEKKEQRAENEAKLTEMERQNEAMKVSMREYRADGNVSWNIFKSNLDASMEKLGTDISDMGKNLVAPINSK